MTEDMLIDMPESISQFRGFLNDIVTGNAAAAAAVRARQDQLTKPLGSLGRLEDLCAWMACWQGNDQPRADRVLINIYAGNHGVAAHNVSLYPPEVTRQMIANFRNGGAAINQLATLLDAELRVHEMASGRPSGDFTSGPALTSRECAEALAYGRGTIDGGFDLLCLGEMGIGNTSAAAALCCALYGGSPEEWVGPGTGLDSSGVARKIAVVAAGLQQHAGKLGDPLEVLRLLGGHELAAIAGAVVGARQSGVPVLLDGFVVCAAAAVLHALDPTFLDHCQIGHVSQEPGHRRLLTRLEKTPLLDLNMRLGEGSGAATAVFLLRSAAACHNGMHTFSEAGVSEAEET